MSRNVDKINSQIGIGISIPWGERGMVINPGIYRKDDNPSNFLRSATGVNNAALIVRTKDSYLISISIWLEIKPHM